jgi:hypothetical protein
MPVDVLTNADLTRIVGPVQINSDPAGAAASLSVNGQTVISSLGNVTGGVQTSGVVQTLVNTNTINTAGLSSTRVTAAGAVTGIILQPGTVPDQRITVIHEGAAANTATFAAAGTSNVAGGVTDSIAGLHAHIFVWDAITSLWYLVGPVAN